MPDPEHPVKVHATRVIMLPAEIVTANARQTRERLTTAALIPGVTTVIGDMTCTKLCDIEGAYSLAQAHRDAVNNHVKLRLVVPSADVMHLFASLGLDVLLSIHPTMGAALGPALEQDSLPSTDENAVPALDAAVGRA